MQISTSIDIRSPEEVTMERVQLALNVDDVDSAVEFYGKLFDAKPAKVRPGYANFALDSPALKLVLIENPGRGGTLNHLGVEVASTGDVATASARLSETGLQTRDESGTCCYALQDKVWVNDPDGAPWEIYTVLADAEVMSIKGPSAEACCGGAEGAACC
jgi:catechol 2,3-dioxygenase-like lactoylglutathione lyase family enzyme